MNPVGAAIQDVQYPSEIGPAFDAVWALHVHDVAPVFVSSR
jgi:hypothetical protein